MATIWRRLDLSEIDGIGLNEHVGQYASTAAASYEMENYKVKNAWLASFTTDYVLERPENDRCAVLFEQLGTSTFKALPASPGVSHQTPENRETSDIQPERSTSSESESSVDSTSEGFRPSSEDTDEDSETDYNSHKNIRKLVEKFSVQEIKHRIMNRLGQRLAKKEVRTD